MVIDIPALRSRRVQTPNLRVLYLGLTYSFGGKGRPARDPGFDFQGAGAPAN